jgi:hypothetical protein
MGRWAPKFDGRQKEACVAAADRGMNAAAVVAAAAAGTLEDDLEPFVVSESIVRKWMKQAALGYEPPEPGSEPDPPPETDPIADRARRIAEKTVDRIEAIDNPTGRDLTDLRTALSIIEDVDRRGQRRATGRKSRRRATRNGDSDAASDLARRLLAADQD